MHGRPALPERCASALADTLGGAWGLRWTPSQTTYATVVSMKEYSEPNYLLKIRELCTEEEPEVARFLSEGWLLVINHITDVVFVPYIPTSPWPPPRPSNLEHARDRDEATRIVLSKSSLVVTPTKGYPQIEELGNDNSNRQTIFWVTPEHYSQVSTELLALSERSHPPGDQLHLSDLEDDRKILCLH